MARFTPSSNKHPCKMCDRTHDGDCRESPEGVVYCHTELNGVKPGRQHPERPYVYCGQTKRGHECGIWKPLELCTERPEKTPRDGNPYKEYTFYWWDGSEVPVKRFRLDRTGEKSVKKWRSPGLCGRPQSEVAPFRWQICRPELTAGEMLFVLKGELKTEQLAAKGFHAISILDPSERLISELRRLVAQKITVVLAPDCDLADLGGWYAELIGALPQAHTLMPPLRGMDWRFPPADGGLGVEDWIKASSPDQDEILRAVTTEPWDPAAGIVLTSSTPAPTMELDGDDLTPADQAVLEYVGEGWIETEKSGIKATQLNAGAALTEFRKSVPAAAVRLNIVTGLVEVNGAPFAEADLKTFYSEMQAQGWNINKEACMDALLRIAEKNRYIGICICQKLYQK